MKTFDKYMQLILAALMLVLAGFTGLAGLLGGLFFIGAWQLISALITSISLYVTKGELSDALRRYWLLALTNIAALFFAAQLNWDILIIALLIAAPVIGFYYFRITVEMERRIRWQQTFIR
jgi:hypothetical protein